MSLTQQSIDDLKQITSNGDDFGVSITLKSPDGFNATFNGFHTKHHLGIDNEGNDVNSKKASVAFSEGNLPTGYSIRVSTVGHMAFGEVNLKNYKVDVADSTGVVKNYKAQQWFPDEKLGLIVLILDDHVEN